MGEDEGEEGTADKLLVAGGEEGGLYTVDLAARTIINK